MVLNFIATVLGLTSLIAFLILGQSFLIPLAIAIMLWYIIGAISSYIEQIQFRNYRPLKKISRLLALFLIIFILSEVILLVGDTVEEVSASAGKYQGNINQILDRFSNSTSIKLAPVLKHWVNNNLHLDNIIARLAGAIMSLANNIGMVLVYLIFFMIEQRYFLRKLRVILPDAKKRRKIILVLDRIQQQIRRYLYIKTLTSLLTALLSYLVLIWLGVDYASFWALIIFMFNYIPVIGSFIAVLLPTLLSLIQFDYLTPFLTLLLTLGSLQFFIGNILEPKMMGSSLNLSPLMVILTLFFWGQIWGVSGMFLSVPITVLSMIIMANFDYTRPIAVFLSKNGQLDT